MPSGKPVQAPRADARQPAAEHQAGDLGRHDRGARPTGPLANRLAARQRTRRAPYPRERAASLPQPTSLPKWRALGRAFWTKINNDWIFNLAGLLAYNFLVALFPILLLLLAGVGAFLGSISPQAQQQLEYSIAAALPGNTGALIVRGIIVNLTHSVSLLLVIGLVGAYLGGSRLFVTLEDCFSIIFRLPGRGFVRQNLMALGLLLLNLLFICVVFLGALIPNLLSHLFPLVQGSHASPAWRALAGQPVLSLLVSTVAVGLAYAFVPNRPVRRSTWREIWPGALVAAVLLLAYEVFFPWYQAHFVHTDNYGSIGAFAIVILLFFYYLALILLLGAEVNSWVAGHRATPHNLPGILHVLESE